MIESIKMFSFDPGYKKRGASLSELILCIRFIQNQRLAYDDIKKERPEQKVIIKGIVSFIEWLDN